MTRLLLERGWRVLRLNLRGAGPSRPLCGQHYYAGRSQDFRAALSLLPEELTRDGIMAIGYSLGGAMLLKYLGEEGAGTPLRAAAASTAGTSPISRGRFIGTGTSSATSPMPAVATGSSVESSGSAVTAATMTALSCAPPSSSRRNAG